MDKYTVEFRIEGLDLIPTEVTKILELSPCYIRDIHTRINKKDTLSLWAYDGMYFEEDSPSYEWDKLEEGLLFLLNKLELKSNIISTDLNSYKRYFWCGHFQEGLKGGSKFSLELLKKLSDFNTEIIINNYGIE